MSGQVNEDLYYIQNVGYCGNCLIWWKDGGHGYTSNLDKAWKLSREKAEVLCASRPKEDVPWLASTIDGLAVRHLDSEDMRLLSERERN